MTDVHSHTVASLSGSSAERRMQFAERNLPRNRTFQEIKRLSVQVKTQREPDTRIIWKVFQNTRDTARKCIPFPFPVCQREFYNLSAPFSPLQKGFILQMIWDRVGEVGPFCWK